MSATALQLAAYLGLHAAFIRVRCAVFRIDGRTPAGVRLT